MKVINLFCISLNGCLFILHMFAEQAYLNFANLIQLVEFIQGNLLLTMKRTEAAVSAFRGAQELRPDIRSYQG